MYKLFLLLSCLLITSGSICQSLPSGFPDTPTITENAVGRTRIGMPVTKLKELYKGCTFTPAHLAAYGFDDTSNKPGGILVSSAGQKLFLYFADWQTKKKVAGILAFHPAYKTVKGIHAGSTSGQLKAAIPTIKVVPNIMMPVFQIAFAGEVGAPGIEYVFFKQKNIGKYVLADEPGKITVLNAPVSWIQIYPHE